MKHWTHVKAWADSRGEAGQNSPLVAFQVSGGKLLHEPVYLLGFSGEPEALQENPQRRDKVFALEVHLIHVGVHHLFIEAVVVPQEFSHLSLSGGRERVALEFLFFLFFGNAAFPIEREGRPPLLQRLIC